MNDSKVVSFPNSSPRKPRQLTGDEKLAHDARKAWRALKRAIDAAECAGLRMEENEISFSRPPTFVRKYF